MTKAYKITVTMPASVQMTDIPSAPVRQAEQMPAETAQWQTTETVMYTADNRAFLVQTTVIR